MEKVIDFLLNTIKLNKDDIIVIGVSGGPDSMGLLHILENLRKKIAFKIIVAHVNHNLRIESAEEAQFLEDYCNNHDLLYEYMKIDKYGDDNFHNEARNIRYAFYRNLINKYHANYLMTGHHGDDLMETILMRITRGASFKGYSGFSSIVDEGSYKIVRPLIFVTKDDLLKYVNDNKVPYRIDKSNFKDKYTRNRYRKNVLPFLKEEDPLVHEKFLKFSKTLLEYDEYINNIMALNIDRVYHNGVVDIKEFSKLSNLIQKRIVDFLFEKIYSDDLLLINDKHMELFFNLVNSNRSSMQYNLPNDYLLIKSYDKIYFKKNVDAINSYDMLLDNYVKLPNGMVIEKVDSCNTNGNDILRLSSNDITLPLRVRTRKNGDKIKTLHGGTKKVKDIFIDKKIPLEKRDNWPIVVDAKDTIVFIPFLKKSKFNRLKSESCDIIFKCY